MKTSLIPSLLLTVTLLVSCDDCYDHTSGYVSTVTDNTLSSAADTVYSVIGILGKVQAIADRTVLFGDLRADLIDETAYTDSDLRELIQSDVSPTNAYLDYRDYYAVINNCNYFLANADTTVRVAGQQVFLREMAVVKAIRAWTYLQLVLTYGQVPFYTQPILQVADALKDYPRYDLPQVCDFFIADLLPFVDTPLPSYGDIYGLPSRKFFFPVQLVLGDLYLWSQRYREAADCYGTYLAEHRLPTGVVSTRVSSITANDEVISFNSSWISTFTLPTSDEVITLIPMAESKLEGVKSQLANIFSSTEENDQHYRVSPSQALVDLAMEQDYAYSVNARTLKHLTCGDMRFYSIYPERFVSAGQASRRSTTLDDDEDILTNAKFTSGHVSVYRVSTVYLRLAECLNRLGDSTTAFSILKDGGEMTDRGGLLHFEATATDEDLYRGIHARGSGEAFRNAAYVLPELPSRTDTLLYVEDLILDEMALENSFEGTRFYDLMRISLRRSDPTYLATHVASRAGLSAPPNASLHSRLSTPQSWYLPHP